VSISYGRLTFQNDRWVMSEVPPHVAIRLKNMFPRVPKHQTKVFDLPNTTSMCADLGWFLSRYPMDMTEQDRVRLALGGEEFERDRQATEQILMPDWVPPEKHGFRPGLDAYPMQKQAAELWFRKKGLADRRRHRSRKDYQRSLWPGRLSLPAGGHRRPVTPDNAVGE